jgi:hypothetical protein
MYFIKRNVFSYDSISFDGLGVIQKLSNSKIQQQPVQPHVRPPLIYLQQRLQLSPTQSYTVQPELQPSPIHDTGTSSQILSLAVQQHYPSTLDLNTPLSCGPLLGTYLDASLSRTSYKPLTPSPAALAPD